MMANACNPRTLKAVGEGSQVYKLKGDPVWENQPNKRNQDSGIIQCLLICTQ